MSGLEQILLAAFLFLTMFGMGSTLPIDEFRRVARRPAPLSIGVVSQFLWMPLAAFLIALMLRVPLLYGVLVVPASALVALYFRARPTADLEGSPCSG